MHETSGSRPSNITVSQCEMGGIVVWQMLRVARVTGSQIITQDPITLFCSRTNFCIAVTIKNYSTTKNVISEQIWLDYTCELICWADLGPKYKI
jgi:hypothetical protein